MYGLGLPQSYRQLMWRKFRGNGVAVTATLVVIGLYLACAVFAEFFAPYQLEYSSPFLKAPPQWLRLRDSEGKLHWPFVYGYEKKVDDKAMRQCPQ